MSDDLTSNYPDQGTADAVDAVPKKSNSKIIAMAMAGLGVLALVALWFIGQSIYAKMYPQVPEAVENAPFVRELVNTPAPLEPPLEAASQAEIAVASLASATQGAVPQVPVATVGNLAMSTEIASLEKKLDTLTQRLERLEQRGQAAKVTRSAQTQTTPDHTAKQTKAPQSKSTNAAALAINNPATESSPRVVAPASDVKTAVAVEPAPVEQGALKGYRLRGVFPPTGQNRQAWILDQKTNAILLATDGVALDPAGSIVVKRVEIDKVVTTRGIID